MMWLAVYALLLFFVIFRHHEFVTRGSYSGPRRIGSRIDWARVRHRFYCRGCRSVVRSVVVRRIGPTRGRHRFDCRGCRSVARSVVVGRIVPTRGRHRFNCRGCRSVAHSVVVGRIGPTRGRHRFNCRWCWSIVRHNGWGGGWSQRHCWGRLYWRVNELGTSRVACGCTRYGCQLRVVPCNYASLDVTHRRFQERVKPATGRPYVRAFSLSGTVPAFTCDCLRFVCAFTRRRKFDLCVSTSSRTSLRSEITSVSRVAHVLLLRLVAGNMDVNTPASKRSQLIGNTAIVRKRCVIHKKSTCVC